MGTERASALTELVEDRPSPSWTVRAVIATSKPRSASASAAHRPMPRLAPVTMAFGSRAVSMLAHARIVPSTLEPRAAESHQRTVPIRNASAAEVPGTVRGLGSLVTWRRDTGAGGAAWPS